MIKYRLIIAAAIGASFAITPVLTAAPQERREEHKSREYHFREGDATKLREHYRANFREGDRIEASHRVRIIAGGHLPGDWKVRIHRVPEVILRDLPPIPTGLEVGYLDGYAIVYDPVTGEVVEMLDVWPD
jgi:hypothetical protein